MLIEFILKNFGTFIELAVMLGGGLIMIGVVKKEMQNMKERLQSHEKRLDDSETSFNDHLLEGMPHKSCLVEVSKQADLTSGLAGIAEVAGVKALMQPAMDWEFR